MNYEITDNFIGIFDNCFAGTLCERYIKHYDELEKRGICYTRQQHVSVAAPKHKINDTAIDLLTTAFKNPDYNINYISREFLEQFWTCFNVYSEHYSILGDFGKHSVFDIKLQKTAPGEGFHAWHAENMTINDRGRIAAFMLYLNDVEEGGETEFLYLKKRIKPQQNRLLIWPAGFTHTHRGNPPLSNNKYIVTGWVELGA
jgi:hypothetical protein